MRAGTKVGVGCVALGALLSACASEAAVDGRTDRGLAVGQGGAQDFAQFRSIVEAGGVPQPETLDAVGFFAEHAVDLPPPACGEAVCVHASLAVAPRFDGGNWTMAFLGMNTPLDPAALPRPPVHLVLAVDTSASTLALRADLLESAREMLAPLRAEDRVSLVRVGAVADRLVASVAPSDRSLARALEILASASDEGVALYDGLAVAGQAALERPSPDALAHVTLLSSGAASRGITGAERIVSLAEGLAAEGVSISVIGGGDAYDDRIPVAIGEIGTGASYYAADAADLRDVLALEGRTRLVPIATELVVTVTPAEGYRVGRVYGARRMTSSDGEARLESPVLLIGQRDGASDIDRGRRGGGGGLFVELIADPLSGVPRDRPAFTVRASYLDATGRAVTQEETVTNGLTPGENPPMVLASLSDPDPARAKVFMMLNMYLGLRAATELFDASDCSRAVGVIDMMGRAVDLWQTSEYADPDTAADWQLLLDLRENIETQCEATFGPVTPIEPRSFAGGCMMS